MQEVEILVRRREGKGRNRYRIDGEARGKVDCVVLVVNWGRCVVLWSTVGSR